MPDHFIRPPGPPADGAPDHTPAPQSEGGLRAPPGLGPWGKFWWWFHFVILVKLARLRFIAILAAIGLVIVKWDTLKAYYEHWTRPDAGQEAAHSDTEFWCPMHPTIVRDHPDKCPICGMVLSQRKKGETGDAALPPGAVSRVQLTPYQIAMTNVRTSEVGYRSLSKEIRAVGFVEFDERKLARITAKITGRTRLDKLYVNVTGQHVNAGDPLALVYNPDLVVTVQNLRDAQRSNDAGLLRMARQRLRLWGIEEDQLEHALHTEKDLTHLIVRSPISGHVIKKYQVEGESVEEGARLYDIADLRTVWVEAQVYEDELAYLKKGLAVSATTKALPNRTFNGKIAFVHPHLDAATRTLRVRFDLKNPRHELRPGMYATVTLQVPVTQVDLTAAGLAEQWRDALLGDGLAHALAAPMAPPAETGLEPLMQAAVRQAAMARGLVLAVPESAVIDTGARKFVYREAWPGEYHGLEVQLGPRCGGFYPVLRGLEAGDKVVTVGAFLVDAETRLTSGAGSTYFGATGGPQSERRSATEARPSMSEDEDAKVLAVLAKLSRVDRRLAEAQAYCPVRQTNRLGGMGVPVKLTLKGQPVFLCCGGCEKEAREHADRTLDRVQRLKAGARTGGQVAKAPAAQADEEREARALREAALAKLSPADRRLAEAQGFCPIQQENQLGSMGRPFKVMIQGRPVFLCCDGCAEEAEAHPQRTLTIVDRLKARGKGGALPR
jgi:Cu(I)/Ag(I) efflux system membrane fusion protein